MFKSSAKKNFNVFCYLFKIQTVYWSQNIMNLFLGIGVSLYTMVCWLAFKSNDPFLMISGISVGLVRNAMYIHLKTVLDFRDKGWDQRLSLTPIPEWLASLATIAFNIFSTLIICTFMFLVAMIFFKDQRVLLTYSNQGMVWAGLILAWFTSYAVGNFIFIYIKNNKIGQMVGLLMYFTTMYFLGLGFPFERIINVQWLNYTLYAHPFRYVMNIVQAGFVNRPNFIYYDPNTQSVLDFGYKGISWLPYVLAIAMFSIYWILYEVRYQYLYAFHRRNKYGEFVVKDSSARYISQIRSSKSIEEMKNLHDERMKSLANISPQMEQIVNQVQRESKVESWFRSRNEKKSSANKAKS